MRAAWLAAFAASAIVASPATGLAQRAARQRGAAEPPPITGPLSLADAVNRALHDDPEIRISERAADAALGAAISAHAVYDATVTTSAVHSRSNGLHVVPAATAGDSPTIQSALTSTVTSSVTAQQHLPWAGLTLTPQVSLTSAGSPGSAAQSRATTQLGMTLPLGRDRWGGLVSSIESAAYAEADATGHDLRQSAAQGVYSTVNAYWAYVAARQRLEVFLSAEEHAKQNLQQTTELVAADERPASDLVQLRGNVASKTSTRISAEQAVLEAWRSLAMLLGLGDIPSLVAPNTSTDFPAVPASASVRPRPSDAKLQALIDSSRGRRPDLAAASTRVKELELGVKTTDHLQRPIINLIAQVGYSGLDEGWGVSQFVGPLYRNRSPLNASLQLSYQFAAANSDAAGKARSAAAALDEEREAKHAVDRSVSSGVVVAVDGLRRAIASADAAHLSTEAAQQTVANEQRKFRLGSSTAFDIILAEDNLTSALLADVAGRQTYAGAVARVLLETGTIVTGERQALVPNVTGLLRAPSIVAAP
jgi:outer membrane protein TolC